MRVIIGGRVLDSAGLSLQLKGFLPFDERRGMLCREQAVVSPKDR